MSSLDLPIRPFTPADLSAAVDLFLEVFNAPPWNEAWERPSAQGRLGDCLATPGFSGWVAERDGRPAALAVGCGETYEQQRHFYLKEMCVRPSLQRQGVGRALVSRMMDDLTTAGVARIYLLTTCGGDAEAFYERCGFYVSPKMILMSRRFGD